MGVVKGTTKDVTEVDKSSPQKEAESIVVRAKAQAAKIVQDAQVRAKQIIADALAESGQTPNTVEQGPAKSWYFGPNGERGVFEVGKEPKGWYDSPEGAKKAPKKKAARKK